MRKIVGEVPRGGAAAPLREMNLGRRISALADDLPEPLQIPERRVRGARPHPVDLVAKRNVRRVGMRRNEVQGKLFPRAKLKKFADPNASPLGIGEVLELAGEGLLSLLLFATEPVVRNKIAGCGSANPQAWIDGFHRRNSRPIQFEIFASG